MNMQESCLPQFHSPPAPAWCPSIHSVSRIYPSFPSLAAAEPEYTDATAATITHSSPTRTAQA